MDARLRRLLYAAGSSRDVRALVRELDKDLVDRKMLEESVQALTALLHRAQRARAAPGKPAAKARFATGASALALFELSPLLEVRAANEPARTLCGGEDPVGQKLFDLLEPLDAPALTQKWLAKLGRGEPVAKELACSAVDGRALACDFVLLPRQGKDGALARVTAVVRDETERVEKQEAVRASEERLALALAGAADALFDWDLRANKIHLSQRFGDLLGGAKRTGAPTDWFDRVHPEDAVALRAALTTHLEGRVEQLSHEHRIRHENGEYLWFSVRGVARRDEGGKALRIAGLMTDVTNHRLMLERMAHDARHDGLTGLPNRTLFLDLLRHSYNRTRRHEDYRFGVLFIDIDRFKMVNDALGHEAGDQLLMQIARRLESCLREGDTLARHGGDEFTMWLDDVRGSTDALRVAERVHEVMAAPFELGSERVTSSASIGLAVGSATYKSAEEVLRDADVAMYRAKALGNGRTAVYQRETDAAPSGVQLETDLRSALQRNEMCVFYMPIVEIATGRVKGLEALARWQHPRLGLVTPPRFLQMAMETGLIVPIDQWMLLNSVKQLNEWRKDMAAARNLSMSVNVSQKLLEQQDLGAQIDRVLREAHLSPADLTLDVGEATPTAVLGELRQRGYKLHMDDFGKGESWLRHLHKSQVDTVKLDRSFVDATQGADRRILSHIVSIARDLGKTVIAEGVETAEQLRLVREAGCECAQGYFFSPPLDAAKARTLLQLERV
ncbi:MAG TPA: EAL domain-containing protein [Myxococcales bacterium]|jgi:diguanylate cyclase (GGDEF)-like protein/PAS domain S-box-containing protein